jgi:hypothetical protein
MIDLSLFCGPRTAAVDLPPQKPLKEKRLSPYFITKAERLHEMGVIVL